MQILIVDDEPTIRQTLRIALETQGHAVAEATSGPAALKLVERQGFELVLVDMRLGQESGLDLLGALLEGRPGLAVVVITAHASIDTAVEAMRRGAFDYLPKPFTPAQIRALLDRVARVAGLRNRVADLEERVRAEVPEVELDSPDPAVRRALEHARIVAATAAVVLIRGENGTGKGVLARTLHAWSRRAAGPFVTVSCPSLGAELLESELFGHVRGAFTGAVRDAVGKVAAAEGGTLFLDEIGDLPVSLQPKLLRFLQERQYERVGEATTRSADVRLMAATNRDLEAAVAAGQFREDLLYRLNVDRDDPAPAPRADRRARPRRPPARLLRPPDRPTADRLFARGRRGDGPPRLAGQPPRAPQRHRARGDPRRGARDRAGRPPRTGRARRNWWPARRRRGRPRRQPGPARGRAHPPRSSPGPPTSTRRPPSSGSTRAPSTASASASACEPGEV